MQWPHNLERMDRNGQNKQEHDREWVMNAACATHIKKHIVVVVVVIVIVVVVVVAALKPKGISLNGCISCCFLYPNIVLNSLVHDLPK